MTLKRENEFTRQSFVVIALRTSFLVHPAFVRGSLKRRKDSASLMSLSRLPFSPLGEAGRIVKGFTWQLVLRTLAGLNFLWSSSTLAREFALVATGNGVSLLPVAASCYM